MKTLTQKWFSVSLAMVALVLVAASTARADQRIVAKVPFSFVVGDKQLPAGGYEVSEWPDGSGLVSIEDHDGKHITYVHSVAAEDAPGRKPQLVFEKFNGEYFLARVVPPNGDERDIVLTPSIMEHEIVATGGSAK